MKNEFIEFLNALMAAAPDIQPSESVKTYIAALMDEKTDKPDLTDNGKLILKYLQDNPDTLLHKSRDIAEGLFISSRTVSGAMRKLTNDGFVSKVSADPVIYTLTEKGKNYKIED